MDGRPGAGLARFQRYALAVWYWRARSRIACSPTKYAKLQWALRCRSDSGRAERPMSGDRARNRPAACGSALVFFQGLRDLGYVDGPIAASGGQLMLF
jgi:hypothetical protein